MDQKTLYQDAIRRVAGKIRECAPEDLIERFSACSGFDAGVLPALPPVV